MSLHHSFLGDSSDSRAPSSRPNIVLIHGLFGSLENLGGIARQLTEDYNVYSVDLPNHGRSVHTADITLASMTEMVKAWMDENGLKKAYVFGHSLGGKVAMELALRYPEIVERIVVVDIAPVHYPPHHDEVFSGLLAVEPTQLSSRGEADKQLAEHVEEVAIRSFLLKNLVKQVEGGFRWRMNLAGIHQAYPSLIQGNSAGAVFEGPVLFIKGGDSDYIQESHRADIMQRFPKANLKVVVNTGHWLHAEKPAVVAKLTRSFLEK